MGIRVEHGRVRDVQEAAEVLGGGLLMAKDVIDEYAYMFPENIRKELKELREYIITVVPMIDDFIDKVKEKKRRYI